MATLPTFSRTIDDAFTSTWYEIRPDAMDNILNATPIWALLKSKGCFKEQVGGDLITRTVKYAVPTALEVAKGDVFSQGETETETMAQWRWRYLSAHVQRSIFDDQTNQGKFRIKSYVSKRLEDARNALAQRYETDMYRAHVTDETGKNIQGLNDVIPPAATRATGTYGKIARPTTFSSDAPTVGNTWWTPKYKQLSANPEINLISDMRSFYNTVHNNQEPPDVIITDKTFYEMYEDFGGDASQVVKDDTSMLLDLGFEAFRFKGKPLIWTPNITAGSVMMLNTKYIEVVYDPTMFFEMTNWKDIPLQGERIAHILCAMTGPITDQPRRHGLLYT